MLISLAQTLADPKSPRRLELEALVTLAAPLAMANLGQMLLGLVDTAVVGRLGDLEIGAVGLGSSVFYLGLVLGMGIMMGFDPQMSQAVGAGDQRRSRWLLWQGLWMVLLLAAPLTVMLLLLGQSLELLGIEPAVAHASQEYLWARATGLTPFLLFVVLRSYLQAHAIARPMVIGVLLANLVNLPLSWVLVFGAEGLERLGIPGLDLPALGVAGAGWASTACTLVQMGVLLGAARAQHGPVPSRRIDWAALRKSFVIGLPIGLQMVAEFGVFGIVALLAGNISAASLAGHQVAITLASATFMVPVGIGAAASVRVGHAVGRGEPAEARRAGLLGVGLGASFMLGSALIFALFPGALARVVTDQPKAVEAAVPLLAIAAVFQLSDGIQAVGAGALRGAGETRVALVANLVGHYLVGLPLGVTLAFVCGQGASGLWWGLSAGLTLVAAYLVWRFERLFGAGEHKGKQRCRKSDTAER